ncbi:SPOR domain-containing protein [Galbibacter mesophilus]|uniref:SPOR domain-containing protein n=1 Tax=Galbibacter mesophilus TaxID=379069 RepID=UPI00191ECFEB|nr:SPOR domain-containing protein [Galbibacter mesophilus]MCM5663541.1 SPOR domain-containing protein [Galbibacter mesophilus]
MPYIDENHLVNLHKTIESKEVTEERLLQELRKQRAEKQEIYRKKNIFQWLSFGLILLMLLGVVLYYAKPSFFINDTYLQSNNKVLIDKNTIDDYEGKISQLTSEIEKGGEKVTTSEEKNIEPEVIYAVQVAALKNKDLSLYSEGLKSINKFKDKSFNKYSLGSFLNLEDAKTFRKELIALGFEDAFVASYKNGKRLKIEEAF